MDYMVLILVWCPYVASASLFSTSFDKIEESQSTTSSRNIIIDSSIESDSHTDPLTRYLEEDNGGNRQIMLLGSLIVCFLMVAFCCSRIVLSVRNQAELVASSESIREATNANLSLDQRRAILKMLFNDDTKFADTKSGKGKGVATQDDYHDTTMDEREGDNVKGVSGDEESPDTPLTQDMTWFPPGGSQHMVTKEDDASPVKSSLQVLVKNSKAAAVVVPDTALPFARPLSALYADTDSDVEKQDCDVDVTKAETNVDDDVDSIEGDLCSICLGVYEEDDSIVASKHCAHYFHRECIIQWLESEKSDYKCPECRNHMITTDELQDAASRLEGDEIVTKNSLRPRYRRGVGMVTRNHGIVNQHPPI